MVSVNFMSLISRKTFLFHSQLIAKVSIVSPWLCGEVFECSAKMKINVRKVNGFHGKRTSPSLFGRKSSFSASQNESSKSGLKSLSDR
jgi:hypothetical protein